LSKATHGPKAKGKMLDRPHPNHCAGQNPGTDTNEKAAPLSEDNRPDLFRRIDYFDAELTRAWRSAFAMLANRLKNFL
jgi:hypothetical protein